MLFKHKRLKRKNIGERINCYIETIPARKCEPLQRGIKHVETVDHNANTIRRIVEASGGQRFVVRFFPYDPHKEKALEHCYVTLLFQQRGLNTPHVVYKDTSKDTRKEFDFDVVVETEIQGTPLPVERVTVEPALRGSFADELVKLHTPREQESGKTWRPVNERKVPLKYFTKTSELYISRIDKDLENISSHDQKYFMTKLEHLMSFLKPIKEFCLIHGDLQKYNVLLGPGESIMFLDFGRSCLGYFEEDLVKVFTDIYDGAKDGFNDFLENYLAGTSEQDQERFQHTWRFFLLFYYLEKASSSAVKVRKIREDKNHTTQPDATTKLLFSKAERFWEKFLITLKSTR